MILIHEDGVTQLPDQQVLDLLVEDEGYTVEEAEEILRTPGESLTIDMEIQGVWTQRTGIVGGRVGVAPWNVV